MSKNLVIVESPAKAKTIKRYLGADYNVVSSFGHIRDLPKKSLAIDIENGFKPTYEIDATKKNIVRDLKSQSKRAAMVYLASDDDREGESISWHLKEALNLDSDKIKRIVFREITKKAILNAIKNPRALNENLVNSQQARRVLDRIVGYDLSPILWKKIKMGLSAGRVQSVAVRMISERERQIASFQSEANFAITSQLKTCEGDSIKAELPNRIKSKNEALSFLERCKGATFTISNLEKKDGKRSPSPPFITSTLQQEASSKLGYSVTKTMLLAQRLYEGGKISYMRTDSLNLSTDAIENAKKIIISAFGSEYFQHRVYKTKMATAQEAHEAIRPTDFADKKVSDDANEQRLYDLIWARAMASQMSDAQIERTIVTIAISTLNSPLIANGEILKFAGFMKACEKGKTNTTNGNTLLPPLSLGKKLIADYLQAKEKFTAPPARYSEASLVRQLEERGIGRPSTYAPTISTIQKRGYIVKEDRLAQEREFQIITLKNNKIEHSKHIEKVGSEKQKLFPTDIAMIVNDFLTTNFPDVTDYDFTARVEEKLDAIAKGNKIWHEMLEEFYKDFKNNVESIKNIDRSTINGTKTLGKDPKTGAIVIARLGRYGPLIQIGENSEDGSKKAKFASLQANQRIDTISLEEALDLFKLPREVGVFEEKIMIVNAGRFGPYIKHDEKFYSIGKQEDPFTIDLDKCITIIEEKRKADIAKIIKQFDNVPTLQILNGRFGPYIKYDNRNIKIPKTIQDHANMTKEECLSIVNADADKNKKTTIRKS